MTTVYTLAELESAIKRREKQIVCRGTAATAIRSKAKKRNCTKKVAGVGMLAAIGGLALVPFTGGASAIPAICGATASVGAAALTISTAELAILVGGSIAMVALLKGRRVKFNSDGSVTIE